MTSSADNKNDKRPKFLNLLQIRLPVTGVVSIAHRISGVLLFLLVPLVLFGLERSVRDETSFEALRSLLSGVEVKGVLWVLGAALVLHLLGGIRYLLIDIGVGESLSAARRGAWAVVAGTVALSVLVLVAAV